MTKELLLQVQAALVHHTEQTRPIASTDAAIAALDEAVMQPEQEPVYQYQLANGNWIDQAKESYDYNVKLGQAVVRKMQPICDSQNPESELQASLSLTDATQTAKGAV